MYLLDTNALIILLYGNVADGKLMESALDVMQSSDKLFLSMTLISTDERMRKKEYNASVIW